MIGGSISEGEYATIFEDSFRKYAVDKSCMFRYARRRGAEKKIKEFIRNRTAVTLRTR